MVAQQLREPRKPPATTLPHPPTHPPSRPAPSLGPPTPAPHHEPRRHGAALGGVLAGRGQRPAALLGLPLRERGGCRLGPRFQLLQEAKVVGVWRGAGGGAWRWVRGRRCLACALVAGWVGHGTAMVQSCGTDSVHSCPSACQIPRLAPSPARGQCTSPPTHRRRMQPPTQCNGPRAACVPATCAPLSIVPSSGCCLASATGTFWKGAYSTAHLYCVPRLLWNTCPSKRALKS